jgi:hypothetical protein
MKVSIGCAVAFVALCASLPPARGGEKTQFEDIIKKMLETMGSLTTTLTTIRDEETAKTSQPDLRKAAEKWDVIKKKAKNLPPPSKEEKDRLTKEYRPKLEEAQKKLFAQVARVSAIPGGRQALLEISSVLDKKDKQK